MVVVFVTGFFVRISSEPEDGRSWQKKIEKKRQRSEHGLEPREFFSKFVSSKVSLWQFGGKVLVELKEKIS